MISVEANHLNVIKKTLHELVPHASVWAFGSRVDGTARTYSDLDIVIISKTAIPDEIISDLKEHFDKSDLPFHVDVLDWNSLTDEFRKIIEKYHETIQ